MNLLLWILVTLLVSADGETSGESSDSSSSSHGQQQRPHKPHIVYFLVDNWDEIGYQDPFYITPFMDELASNGIKLTHFYTAIDCTPSRSRLMTGKHEDRYGMQTAMIFPSTPYGMPLYLKTLPDRLRELGYSTHQVGKWHLGHHRREYTPLYRGFDTFYAWDNGTYLEKGCRKFWHDHHRNYFLYNNREDRYEENDLADDPAHFDRIVHMVERLKWWDDQSVPPLFTHPKAWSTVDACPSNAPENVGRTYKYFGPYQTGEDWQLSTPRKEYISPF